MGWRKKAAGEDLHDSLWIRAEKERLQRIVCYKAGVRKGVGIRGEEEKCAWLHCHSGRQAHRASCWNILNFRINIDLAPATPDCMLSTKNTKSNSFTYTHCCIKYGIDIHTDRQTTVGWITEGFFFQILTNSIGFAAQNIGNVQCEYTFLAVFLVGAVTDNSEICAQIENMNSASWEGKGVWGYWRLDLCCSHKKAPLRVSSTLHWTQNLTLLGCPFLVSIHNISYADRSAYIPSLCIDNSRPKRRDPTGFKWVIATKTLCLSKVTQWGPSSYVFNLWIWKVVWRHDVIIKDNKYWGWRKGLATKSMQCSCREPEFYW